MKLSFRNPRSRHFNSQKKDIVRSLVRDKKMSLRYGKPLRNRNNSNPMMKMMKKMNTKRAYGV